MICTSRFHGGYMETEPDEILKELDTVKSIARKKYPDIIIWIIGYWFNDIWEWCEIMRGLPI